MGISMEARYLSIRDTARHLHVSDRTVRRWIARGILRAIRLGKTIRIEAKALDRLPKIAPPLRTGRSQDRREGSDYSLVSEEVLWKTWNNPGDAVYDNWREIYGVRQGRHGTPAVSVPGQDARKGAARRRGEW
jgi:excisionase family DNA binding protein